MCVCVRARALVRLPKHFTTLCDNNPFPKNPIWDRPILGIEWFDRSSRSFFRFGRVLWERLLKGLTTFATCLSLSALAGSLPFNYTPARKDFTQLFGFGTNFATGYIALTYTYFTGINFPQIVLHVFVCDSENHMRIVLELILTNLIAVTERTLSELILQSCPAGGYLSGSALDCRAPMLSRIWRLPTVLKPEVPENRFLSERGRGGTAQRGHFFCCLSLSLSLSISLSLYIYIYIWISQKFSPSHFYRTTFTRVGPPSSCLESVKSKRGQWEGDET